MSDMQISKTTDHTAEFLRGCPVEARYTEPVWPNLDSVGLDATYTARGTVLDTQPYGIVLGPDTTVESEAVEPRRIKSEAVMIPWARVVTVDVWPSRRRKA